MNDEFERDFKEWCGYALDMMDKNDAIGMVISAKYETAMDYLDAQKYINDLIALCLNATDCRILQESKEILNVRAKSELQIELKKNRNNVSMHCNIYCCFSNYHVVKLDFSENEEIIFATRELSLWQCAICSGP